MNLNPVLRLERVGRDAQVMWEQVLALLSFVGEITLAMLGWMRRPSSACCRFCWALWWPTRARTNCASTVPTY
jgi:hypothetical protein